MITGQVLYFVPSNKRQEPREVRVTNVGRKWATLEADSSLGDTCRAYEFGRCEKANGWVDGKGYSSPGRCWPSQADYELYQRRCSAWNSLRMDMELRHPSTEPPEGVTVDNIMAARELLGLWKL